MENESKSLNSKKRKKIRKSEVIPRVILKNSFDSKENKD